jgi:dihydrofolate reductase
MRTIYVTEFISLDGVVEAPGGEENYKHTGWTFDIAEDPTMYEFKGEELFGSETLLMGRTTYEGFSAAWPEREGDFADKFNTMPKYVVSSTLEDPEWTNSTVLDGDDLAGAVATLKARHDGDVVVHGSARLAQALIDQDLVDELRLMVFPVVLGEGKRLFGPTGDKKRLRLSDSQTVGDGVVVLTYERAAQAA